MYHGVSYGKFNTALMLKINTVTSLMCLHTIPVPEAYFCLLRVEELNELTDEVPSIFNFTHTDYVSERVKRASSF